MPDILVHYAAGLALATLLRRERAWVWALLAVAPDVDALTGLLLAPILHARAWSPDAASALVWLFTHRGITHTFLFVALASLAALVATRRRDRALAIALLVGSHVALDMISAWPLHPFWPFWGARVNVGWLRVTDPWTWAASALAILVLIAGPRARSTVPRRAFALVAVALFLSPIAVYAAGGLVAASASAGEPNLRAFPEYQVVEPRAGGFLVHLVRADGVEFVRTDVPPLEMSDALSERGGAVYQRALCEYPRLGPLAWVQYPVMNVTRGVDGWVVRVTDARLVQDASSARGSVTFEFTDDIVLRRVEWDPGHGAFHGEAGMTLDGRLFSHAACAPQI